MKKHQLFFLFLLLGLAGCNENTLVGNELILTGERPNSQFGASVDLLGDINGDGFADFAVAAPEDSRNDAKGGVVSVYFGSTSGPVVPQHALLLGGPNDQFGSYLRGVGDINGDGFEDLLISAAGSNREGLPGQGAAFLFFGSSEGLLLNPESQTEGIRYSETAEVIILNDSSEPSEVPTVSSAGDLDQNGALDIVLAVPSLGRVYIFLNGGVFPNSSRMFLSQADIILTGEGDFGRSLRAAGDVNFENRGLVSRFGDDLLLGAPEFGGKGAAYLVLGDPGVPRGTRGVETLALRFDGETDGEEFGRGLAGVGDFDGDGIGDIAIGAPGKGSGSVRVFFGESVQGPVEVGATTITGEADGDRYGEQVVGMLPYGAAQLFPVVGAAPFNDFNGINSGSAYLLSHNVLPGRGASGRADFSDVIIRNSVGGAGGEGRLGTDMSAGPDINGDGSGDLLLGVPGANSAGVNAGAAIVRW